MGDYLITLEPVNLGSKVVIKDQGQGPVETEITIIARGTGDYKMNGWLKARDPGQQSITEALRLMGRPDNSATGLAIMASSGTGINKFIQSPIF